MGVVTLVPRVYPTGDAAGGGDGDDSDETKSTCNSDVCNFF